MITVLTSHEHIWDSDKLTADIIYEYQTRGSVHIDLNNEGPCADTIGLYCLLDYVCSKFNIDPAVIKITTVNFEEQHSTYTIEKKSQHWIQTTINSWKQLNQLPAKNFSKLFGCLYNVPSWDRLCLLSYIDRNSKHKNQLHCNGTWEANRYNTYYLNTLIDHAPNELSNIVSYLQNAKPKSALADIAFNKPITATQMMSVYPIYQHFLVDVVAETYNSGLSFFITEKTIRPMLALTPFVIQGPQGFLSTLKSDYNIKSFDQWWDEDYDNYQGYERIQKIYKVIDYIDSLTVEQQQKMYNEMMPILNHNFQQILTHDK